jgi:hypothetical protein
VTDNTGVAIKPKKQRSAMGIGVTTLVTILVVMLLATFSVLSLVSARSDLNLSEMTIRSASDYYDANNEATRWYAQLDAICVANSAAAANNGASASAGAAGANNGANSAANASASASSSAANASASSSAAGAAGANPGANNGTGSAANTNIDADLERLLRQNGYNQISEDDAGLMVSEVFQAGEKRQLSVSVAIAKDGKTTVRQWQIIAVQE